MGSTASGKNAEHSSTWAGTATTAAAEVTLARGTNANVACREFAISNTGSTAMSFSLDGGDTWLPLAAGGAFDWDHPLYAVSVKTAAGTTTYAIVAGY